MNRYEFERYLAEYNTDTNYQLNAKSFFHYLGKSNQALKYLSERIWEYDEKMGQQFDEWTTEMKDRLDDWDDNLQQFPSNVENLLQDWMSDGTLDHIINDTIFNMKVDQTEFDEFSENTTSQLAQTVENINSMRINVKHLPAPYVSAVGDGVTDDTLAFQNAMDLARQGYGGNDTKSYGYMGWYMPVIEVPHGVYKVGKVTSPNRFRLEGEGMSVLISPDGSPDEFRGSFIDNAVSNMTVKKIGFLFYDTVFKTPTNNADFSFITFEECNISKLNTLIDMGDYETSRSTTFKMERCNVSYGVRTLVKLFCDKSHFANNWFNHSMDSYFMELDTYATFESNVWVPTSPGQNKAYIYFTGSDAVRSLHFKEERFGGEGGSCPIVIVGDVNTRNTNEQYRHQGISFDNCNLSSNSRYNPNEIVEDIRANIILRPTLSPRNTINFISFKNTAFLPDLKQGIVATYNIDDIKSLLPNNFVIDFDYVSTISGTKGVNKLASNDLMGYVKNEIPRRNYSGVRNSGKLDVNDTDETGVKKTTFNVNLDYRNNNIPSYTFLLVTIGQGDSSYSGQVYAYQSVYMFTVSSVNPSVHTFAEISYTKLHGTVGGVLESSNADIVSAHFGTGEEGDSTIRLTSESRTEDITIVFGERVKVGNAYLIPLYDTSLVL